MLLYEDTAYEIWLAGGGHISGCDGSSDDGMSAAVGGREVVDVFFDGGGFGDYSGMDFIIFPGP